MAENDEIEDGLIHDDLGKYIGVRSKYLDEWIATLSSRIDESSSLGEKFKQLLKDDNAKSPYKLLSEEGKKYLAQNTLSEEKVKAVYEKVQGNYIQSIFDKMEDNKKHLDNKKYCYLRHAAQTKPSLNACLGSCKTPESKAIKPLDPVDIWMEYLEKMKALNFNGEAKSNEVDQ